MVTETPSERQDLAGSLADSPDAIVLKELKSIIQEHSTHRQSPTLRVTRISEETVPQIITILAPTVNLTNKPSGMRIPTNRTHATKGPPLLPSHALL